MSDLSFAVPRLSPWLQSAVDAVVIEQSWRDADAFSELFVRHVEPIHRYVARRMGDASADDLVAQTFEIAFRKRRAYDLTRPDALPWLFGIATKVISGHRRAEARRLKALSEQQAGRVSEAAAHDPMIAEELAGTELVQRLAKLPAKHRDVLLLYAWAELSYAEIAAALSIAEGTVRSRLNRARAALSAHAEASTSTLPTQ